MQRHGRWPSRRWCCWGRARRRHASAATPSPRPSRWHGRKRNRNRNRNRKPHRLGGALGQGEFLIKVSAKQGNWMLATDAWYFEEGEADRWSRARYGELRVDRDGNALLLGLRGAGLAPL